MDYGVLGGNYDYKYEKKKDSIIIPKTTQNLSSEYLKRLIRKVIE